MPGYEKIESLKNGGSWGQFCWKTCGFERVKSLNGIVQLSNRTPYQNCLGLAVSTVMVEEFKKGIEGSVSQNNQLEEKVHNHQDFIKTGNDLRG